MFDGLAYNPRLGIIEPINLHPLMAARDLDEGGQVVQTIVENLLNIYPEFKEVLTATNTTIRENCIVFNTEDNILDYMFVVLGQLAKTIKEKGIDSVITVEDVMLRKTFDSLFQEPKEVVSLYEVLNAMLTKINESDTGNISEAKVVELLSQKADKNHVHYITSDEQIITDYHGYLTQDEQISTEDVNERRYKYIRAKGYDISCTVHYDTGKALEAFSYNDEIYASTFSVKGVLVEPRFTLRVKSKITFEDAIKSKADKVELEAMNKVLKSHKHNISDINELQATLDSKADKNHTHESFTTVRADDIILNYTLGSSAPLENSSTSVKDTLNSLNSKCMNIEGHARNFETHELPAMLDKKADKEHTHKSFTTVRADDIILNYDLGSSAPLENPSTSVKDTLNNLDNSCRNIEGHARNFETHELPAMLDKKADKTYVDENYAKKSEVNAALNGKADKNHTHEEFQTIKIKEIKVCIEIVTKTGRNGATVHEQRINPPTFPNGLITNNINIVDGKGFINVKHELQTIKAQILQTLYPIGSIYTSMNSTNPASVLGFGTWQQIVDKFLYCANSSKQTGGSKKITEANLPPHTHTGTTNFSGDHSHSLRDHPLYNSEYEAGNDVLSPSYNNAAKKIFRQTEPGGNHVHTFTTNPTGSGADYMPPFVTIFAWYRVQ
ncbi:hypothetical protein TVAG_414590 [Trichomonas vaginalis G3]|uniref:Baseplate structural protein Gp10 C-terminal domain-containing protein n=1 Tax=Trichomonas vaginalis (strain ATCC PRA-98 / G3) TaxID=412133 RepID=A2GA13_TRIV3|nr:phage tail repeat-like family [Trichomonas vaginalis G3]EAX86002.1 hypothetical protein TVAG_414590 [Trichomonas vaginalis G3]KAI5494605.1 phage tail repeat-like family [Trichomonas vaginalis G3]|eukprot:XP_001298932.1 hypothetical protein [Trichomonas vaginalis G3]